MTDWLEPVAPERLAETVDAEKYQAAIPSARYVEFDPNDYLQYLPDLEAEIFWMARVRGMAQADIGDLLGKSQPAVGYRYRRAVEKIAYLVLITALDVRGMIREMPFLRDDERAVLEDLFYYLHQDAVGRKHGNMRQSSVKWVVLKTRRHLEALERADPEKWFNHLGLIYLLCRYLGLRLKSV